MTTYRNCQSCGMPMKKDPQGGGTDSDGYRNIITNRLDECEKESQRKRLDRILKSIS